MSRRRFSKPGATFRLFVALSLVFVALTALFLYLTLRVPGLGAYLVAINLATLLTYFYDKTAAVHDYVRVPERVMHLQAAAGGSPAAVLGQAAFRHKTTKASFRKTFWTIFITQIVLLTAWLCYARPWA